jgi:hypothetical protein
MVFVVNGKEICTSQIVYGGPGHEGADATGKVWKSMSKTIGCPDIISVKKGDKLNFYADFDLAEHPL